MQWLLQKRKVRTLEKQLASNAETQRQWRNEAERRAYQVLAEPEAKIWAFSCGLLWGLSDNLNAGKPDGIKRRLGSFVRSSLFIVRVLGLRL